MRPWGECTPLRQKALRAAWSVGDLRYKLDPNQLAIHSAIYASHAKVKSSIERIFCLDISRQNGKDFIMSTIAAETAMRRRRQTRMPYLAPTREEIKELIVPTMELLFSDCPPELQPLEIRKNTFSKSANELTWAWKARVVLVGMDLHPNRARGPATFAFFFTEPAFVRDLVQIMGGVMLPQLLTQPDGFGVMGSTPPVTPAHPWTTKYLVEAKKRGMYHKSVIDDCPRIGPEQRRAAIAELGGPKATATRRELYCEHIIETTLTAIPEMHAVKDKITIERYERPEFCDVYTVIDPGFAHAAGGLFTHLDFERACLVIEGDFAVQRQTSRSLARYIYAREWQLWGYAPVKPDMMTDPAWADELRLIEQLFYDDLPKPTDEGVLIEPVTSYCGDMGLQRGPYMRVSDTEPRLIADLVSEHGLVFKKTLKDGREAAMNRFRLTLQGDGDIEGDNWSPRILIHKRCVNALAHFEHALWNKGRTQLAESADGGHFDCVPAGVYLVRNVDWQHNPIPPDEPRPIAGTPAMHMPHMRPRSGDPVAGAFQGAFRRSRR